MKPIKKPRLRNKHHFFLFPFTISSLIPSPLSALSSTKTTKTRLRRPHPNSSPPSTFTSPLRRHHFFFFVKYLSMPSTHLRLRHLHHCRVTTASSSLDLLDVVIASFSSPSSRRATHRHRHRCRLRAIPAADSLCVTIQCLLVFLSGGNGGGGEISSNRTLGGSLSVVTPSKMRKLLAL
ncbi:hypothetical protein PIB30_069481 [Stylosanthes scabra]|uniref:Uncharacterized protein n=1 Tax=Stylosanthes scabra TaxID=79078 RepID=A0ABU6XPJ3_9FABA|nr:hypothetical protein [Stylosanthes scabra]